MLPVLFEIPTPWGDPIVIYSYGLMLGVALVAGYQLVLRLGMRALEQGQGAAAALAEPVLGNACLITALGGLVGARVHYALLNRELLEDSGARWYDVTAGGVSASGGLLGGLLAAAIYLKLKRAPLLEFGDLVAPAFALGIILVRIGCYLYGSDFGGVLPDGAPGWLRQLGTFPPDSPVHYHHRDRFGIAADVPSLPVHPTQLYEALFGGLLLVLALRVRRRRRFAGQALLLTLGGYGVGRFVLEYLRDDPERGHALGFSSAQLFSMLLVPICAVVYSALLARARRAGSTKAA